MQPPGHCDRNKSKEMGVVVGGGGARNFEKGKNDKEKHKPQRHTLSVFMAGGMEAIGMVLLYCCCCCFAAAAISEASGQNK